VQTFWLMPISSESGLVKLRMIRMSAKATPARTSFDDPSNPTSERQSGEKLGIIKTGFLALGCALSTLILSIASRQTLVAIGSTQKVHPNDAQQIADPPRPPPQKTKREKKTNGPVVEEHLGSSYAQDFACTAFWIARAQVIWDGFIAYVWRSLCLPAHAGRCRLRF